MSIINDGKDPIQSDKDKLWAVCQEFIKVQTIGGSENVYQCDNVILNAYDFITSICDIVGYHEYEDDE